MQNAIAIMPGLLDILISMVTISLGFAVFVDIIIFGVVAALTVNKFSVINAKHTVIITAFFINFIFDPHYNLFYLNIPSHSLKVN